MISRTGLTAAILSMLLISAGCYSSRPNPGNDAGPDAVDTVGDDATVPDALPDAAPDAVPETVDVLPDTPPPAAYSLHEWGVISVGDFGSMVHGPSPTSSDMIAEKPVIYLYSDEEISPLDIGVRFATGAAEDVWPPILTGPSIAWNNMAIRPGACEVTAFPYPWDDPLCEVCNLASCVVEEADCIQFPALEGEPYMSRLLFYAGGVGDYRPPIAASAGFDCDADIPHPCMSFSITNDSDFTIDGAWVIYRQVASACYEPYMACPPGAADLAFDFIDTLAPRQDALRQLTIGHYEAELDDTGWPLTDVRVPAAWQDLGKDLVVALLEKGLTEAEAAAFINNWEDIFFGVMGDDSWYIEPLYTNGAFVIYFMDRAEYDLQFQLSASPPPRETVRVGMIYQQIELYYEL
jgi:hypothetical protein